MNITENTVRCPTVAVMMPIDQPRLTRSTAEHCEGLDRPPEDSEEKGESQHEGHGRRPRAVVERGHHLVVGQRGRAGGAGRDVRVRLPQRPDGAPDGGDELLVVGEVRRLAPGLDEDEQQLLVAGEEVASAGVVVGRGEHARPRRGDRSPVEPVADDVQQRADETGIEALGHAGVEAEVDEPEGEAARDLVADAGDELVEGRARRVLVDEGAMLQDLVAEVGEPIHRQVQEGLPLEQIGIDPMGDPPRRGQGPDLHRQPIGVVLRSLHGRRLDDDDDVVQLAELAQGLLEALDVEAIRGQKLDGRGLERQAARGVQGADGGQRQAQRDGETGPGRRDPYQPGQQRSGR